MRTAWIALLAATAAVAAGGVGLTEPPRSEGAGFAGAGAGKAVGLPEALTGAGSGTGLSIEFLPATRAPAGRATLLPIRVRNNHTTRAVGVSLAVSAPSWVDLAATGCLKRQARLRCSVRDLAAGAAATVRVSVTPSRGGVYRVVAEASAQTIVDKSTGPTRSLAGVTRFRGTVSPISPALARRMSGVSWKPGCPVTLADLRVVRVTYRGFDGRAHTGTLIVHRSVGSTVVGVMRRIYAAGFPIRRMVPVDAYGGDDYRSIEADNTSAFNCRPVAGTLRWSEHAYGRAIDLDPLENPYVSGGTTSHPASRRYLDRSLLLPGMLHADDAVVSAFAAAGWGWGGTWSGTKDYQHFSASGR
jgi:D-alanyl-D-alanine carboxypeptidase-like protein